MLITTLALAALDGHRGHLGLEAAVLDWWRLGALVDAGGGEGVLRLAAEAVLGGAVLAKHAHGRPGS
jgi:hypothetical protein